MAIGICNQKGGVGKTTTAVNLSAQLALMGKKVLLIDMDPQGAATSGSGVGIEKEKLEKTIYDVLVNDVALDDVILDTEVEGLYLVPSNINLSGAELELSGVVGREIILREALSHVEGKYDYVVVDTPPTLGLLMLNAMVACDKLIIPVQTEYYALEGMAVLLRTIDLVRKRLKKSTDIRILLTMYDKRVRLSDEVAKQVRDYFKERVFKTVIPRNIKLAEAPSYGRPVHMYSPDSSGAKAYRKLAEEVISIGW